MKNYKFTIWFEDGTGLKEYATTMYQATILAMAERIKDAKDFYIDCIENEKGESFEVSKFMEFTKIQNA